ncbi:hypothetical protein, partial [Frankia sp. CcWB2]
MTSLLIARPAPPAPGGTRHTREFRCPARARFAAAIHDHAARGLDVVPAVLPNDAGDLVTEHGAHRYLLAQRALGAPLG